MQLGCLFAMDPIDLEQFVIYVYDLSIEIMDEDRIIHIIKNRPQVIFGGPEFLFYLTESFFPFL
ncbi:MAG: hypothetical protein A4E62_03065 [Syntrophorhabdus sp. PtaU1.Bin002]|nr:MAG: hypothetical protein A4E58_02136 [Syntrophorhabdus sp. PtaB.Bin006]OPY61678.1 MAG: hypothetical protein A4E62_03065 [Syntrophorhabdus sp. PtaU1.Bin002]